MKEKLNYKLLNILIITVIIYYLFKMKGTVVDTFLLMFKVVFPFVIAFAIAYVLEPVINYFSNKKIPKAITIILINFIFISTLGLVIYYMIPLLFNQLSEVASNLIIFLEDIEINIKGFATVNIKMQEYLNIFSKNITSYISNGQFMPIVNNSINAFTNIIIIFVSSIYFMFDMEKIRKDIKNIFKSGSKKMYKLVKTLDNEIRNYSKGLFTIMIVQFFEYTIMFYIIGHPNYLLLGFLASVTTIIPYFGGIATNILALILASVISIKLFILTLIVMIVCSNIDGYLISPKIYGKTNKIPPIITIFSVWAGGIIYGFVGILFALPITIILIAIFKEFSDEISDKIDTIKDSF